MKDEKRRSILRMRDLVCVILIAAVLLMCMACRENRERSESKAVELSGENERNEKEPLLIFTIGFSSVAEDYTAAYPSEEVEIVQINENELEENYNKAIDKYGSPDLIIDTCDRGIRYWAESGWIADMSVYFDTDVTFDYELYYPGVDSVGCVNGVLYGLPLGLRIDYLTVRDEVWDDSAFSKLSEAYTAKELFGAVEDELDYWMEQEPEEWKRVYGNSDPYPILESLWASGAIQTTEDEVRLDREIFELVAQAYIKGSKNTMEYSNQFGGFSSLVDPREGEGRYIATNWINGIAPQIGLIYYQSANQVLMNQQIHVLWLPMHSEDESEASHYAAGVAVWGMIGRNSDRMQEAYTVLRQMMDIPRYVYTQVGYFGTMEDIPFSINRQRALEMIDWAEGEYVDTFTIYSDTTVQKQPLTEELRKEMERLLQNITFIYSSDKSIRGEVYDAVNSYFYDNVIDMDVLYDNTLKALQVYVD